MCRIANFIVIAVILLSNAVVQGDDPNNTAISLTFEKSNGTREWPVTVKHGYNTIEPTHVSTFYVRPGSNVTSSKLTKTDAWKTLSQEQQAFCQTQRFVFEWSNDDTTLERFTLVHLYAVSEEDAQKLSQTYLKVLENDFIRIKQEFLDFKKNLEEKISNLQRELPVKQSEYKEVQDRFTTLKRDPRYSSLTDEEASDFAKETVLRMKTLLDELRIKLAEIRARLNMIQQQKEVTHEPIIIRLEEMEIELLIDLAGIEARKEVILNTIEQATTFMQLRDQRQTLAIEIENMEQNFKRYKTNLQDALNRLNNPIERLGQPQVFQNKVTIHPVSIKYDIPILYEGL